MRGEHGLDVGDQIRVKLLNTDPCAGSSISAGRTVLADVVYPAWTASFFVSFFSSGGCRGLRATGFALAISM
jgi:hypothetical protein